MAYTCKRAPNSQLEPPFTVVPQLDVSAHPCVQVLDIVFDMSTCNIINFYHDVHDTSSLEVLTSLDIDELMPMLVMGNFNTHANAWSPPDVPRSRWADQVERWAAQNLLTLANNPGEITHWGADHECDSVIDLAWYNTGAVQSSTFYDLRMDWEGSLGSDHVCLQIAGITQPAANPPREEGNTGYVVDPECKEE